MLPPIPDKLWKIDATTVAEHFSLDPADRCYFIWEYTRHRDYTFSPINQFIKNFKIKPSDALASPRRAPYKQAAIHHAATALRSLISRRQVDEEITFVPIPGSRIAGDPDFDDRLMQTLRLAYPGASADIRRLLLQSVSTPPDHASAARQSFDDLLAITDIDTSAARGLRKLVVLFDDVLNSGKHYKVGRRRILDTCSQAEVRGVFLARCVDAAP